LLCAVLCHNIGDDLDLISLRLHGLVYSIILFIIILISN
jgi:hypothetical protein